MNFTVKMSKITLENERLSENLDNQESQSEETPNRNTSESSEINNNIEKCSLFSRKAVQIACGLSFYFLIGVTEKVTSSYFSPEAERRGLSTFEIGLSPSVFNAFSFGFSFVVMFAIKQKTEKRFCIAGICLLGISYMACSVLHWIHSALLFLIVSVVLNAVVGVGNAMGMATVIPIITKVSLRHAGTVTSLAETLYNLGWLIVTPAGSILYKNFGMFISPLISGLLLLICGLISSILLPKHTSTFGWTTNRLKISSSEAISKTCNESRSSELSLSKLDCADKSNMNLADEIEKNDKSVDETRNFDPWAYVKFLLKGNLMVISMLSIIVAVQSEFFEICLPLYLKNTFQLDAVHIGLVYSAYLFTNVGMIPVYGILVDKGYAMHVTLVTSLGYSVTFGALFLPDIYPSLQNIFYITTCFTIAGLFSSGAIVSSYLIFEKIAAINGFTNLDQTKILVATWANNLFSMGALFGSIVITGHVFDKYGFNTSCLLISVSMFVFFVASLYPAYQMKMLGKLFYVDQNSLSLDCQILKNTKSTDLTPNLDLVKVNTSKHSVCEV